MCHSLWNPEYGQSHFIYTRGVTHIYYCIQFNISRWPQTTEYLHTTTHYYTLVTDVKMLFFWKDILKYLRNVYSVHSDVHIQRIWIYFRHMKRCIYIYSINIINLMELSLATNYQYNIRHISYFCCNLTSYKRSFTLNVK